MTNSENYYEILGIEPDATPEEITKAWRDKCWILHSDRMTGAPESARKKAEAELKIVNEAYEVLHKKERETSSTRAYPPAKPKPVVKPSRIRFSDMEPGQIKRTSFVIDNTGGSYSEIRLINNMSWLKIVNSDSSISRAKLPLEIKIEAKGSDWGETGTEHIKVKLDDEETLVTAELQMKPNPEIINAETEQPKQVNKSRRTKPKRVHVIAFSCVLLFLIVGLIIFVTSKFDTGSLSSQSTTTSIASNPAQEYLTKGKSYFDQKKWDEAITEYTKAIEIDPKYIMAYANRANAYSRKGDYDKAIFDWNKAIELYPKEAVFYLGRGITYNNKGDYDKAITDLNKAIEIDSKDARAYRERGVTYLNKEDYDKAISDYTKAIEIDPKDAESYFNRSLAYIMKDEQGKAEADFNKSKELGYPGTQQ